VFGFTEATSNSGCCAKQANAKTWTKIVRMMLAYQAEKPLIPESLIQPTE